MASSSPQSPVSDNTQLVPLSDDRYSLSSVIYENSQQVQSAMENMLKMITVIDQSSSGIIEDIEKCKDSALERKRTLKEETVFPESSILPYSVIHMLKSS